MPHAELNGYLELVRRMLTRHVARYGHRLTDASGRLEDRWVSWSEAARGLVCDGRPPAIPGLPSEGEASQSVARQREALTALEAGPVAELRSAFMLSERELELLVCAAGPQLSVELARLYRFAWADFTQKRPTVGFLSELTAQEPQGPVVDAAALAPGERLVSMGLLTLAGSEAPHLERAVSVPPSVAAFLAGERPELPRGLRARGAHLVTARAVASIALAAPTRASLVTALRGLITPATERRPLVLSGSAGRGRRTALAAFLAEAGFQLIAVDRADLTLSELTALLREATLRRGALLFRCDEATSDELCSAVERMRLIDLPRRCPVVLSVRELGPTLRGLLSTSAEVVFQPLGSAAQGELWREGASARGLDLAPAAITALTDRFDLAPSIILGALDSVAMLRVRGSAALSAETVSNAVRALLGHRLTDLAEAFTTTLGWDDVVLSARLREQLQEVIAHARFRNRVLGEWGFARKLPYGSGLSCLFSGAPGTGKTMVASLLAKELGRELYRVDVSRLSSKWVGETEKNLRRVFAEAESAQAILLFDEADSLFAKRTEVRGANARFANMEVNYLLQRMETYAGISVLTTNLERGIDEAFKRRIRFKLHFEIPDAALRAELWSTSIPKQAPVAGAIDFAQLGSHFEMSGGNIKNAVVRAAFQAAVEGTDITERHLFEAGHAEATEMGMLVRC